ncbi:hypothetical protein EVAR_99226_1 [Eumeta japonica]|uniref:Uncharacterized protein n=1 Tax=Eumeta variegata TaxID=151549 RepID=A0A4C1YHH8_EUMVA|nr:hypothetical protein EVAR_99226_1 [Eumeta japonica]
MFYNVKTLASCVILGDHGTTACNRNKGADDHPPAFFTAPRQAFARAVSDNLSYAKATAGSRTDPPTNSAPITSPSKDIKALVSMISIIDISEIVFPANKFKAAANPLENILILAEHAPLVEAIKNNKILPVQNIISLVIPYRVGKLDQKITISLIVKNNLTANTNVWQRIWFQKNGASFHCALAVRQHLDNTYPNKWTGEGGEIR